MGIPGRPIDVQCDLPEAWPDLMAAEEAWAKNRIGDATYMDAIVGAAAPHIARAAQVQILRELREVFRDYTNALPAGSPARRAQMVLLMEVVARLAALEAGAGETEEQK